MQKSYLGGVMIIAATIIGAGMLAIPIAGAGVWFYVSVLVLILSGLCMLTSGLFILEVNLQYSERVSFNTIVKDILGSKWNLFTGMCIVFVLYTLIYAYITTGSSLILDHFNLVTDIHRIVVTILFTLFFAVLIWISTQVVDYFSTVLIFSLIITFVFTITNALPNISLKLIADSQPGNMLSLSYWQYLPILLPVCLASFGFHGNVPSLVKYFQGDVRKVKYSICFGVLLALIVYFLWVLIIHGNIPRALFQGITDGKENEVVMMIHLLAEAVHGQQSSFQTMIRIFSFFALTSSFLGVALGLFDYFLDLFHLSESKKGRFIAGLITFLPPLVASLWMPLGFTVAIGYVGLAAAVWAVIIPALLVKKSRRQPRHGEVYQVVGGNVLIYMVIVFGLLNLLSLILVQLRWVGKF